MAPLAGQTGRIRVVVADDSLVAREMLSQILSSDPEIEVVGQASNGQEAVDLVARLRPDLVTMDIHMPVMDGLQATERIMAYTPTPILVVSSSVYGEGMGRAFDALGLGALEVIKKPEPKDWAELERIGRDVIRRVRILANVRVITHIRGRHASRAADLAPEVAARPAVRDGARGIVAIGSSTGGPSALLQVLGRLRAEFPAPILIAQHIADGFVPGLVSWLDSGCKIKVECAISGTKPRPGVAYLASTDSNMVFKGSTIDFEPLGVTQLYVPSVDVLFGSVARTCGPDAVGVIMTGMGADGADGLLRMRQAGAATIGQDEESCTVYGMPKVAAEIGAVERVVDLHDIGPLLERLVGM